MTPLPTGERLANAIESRAIYRIEAFHDLGTLYVSNSTLSDAAACDTKALLAGMGFTSREESIKMRLGSDAHLALAAYRKEIALGMKNADAAFIALLAFDLAYRDWVDDALAKLDAAFAEKMVGIYGHANARRVLEVYLRDHAPAYPFRFHADLVEVPFAVPLVEHAWDDMVSCLCTPRCWLGEGRPSIIACGKLDALVSDASDQWYVDDIKTTGQLDGRFARKFVNDSQFSHYQWGVAEHLGRPVVGGIVTAIEWSRMPVVKLTAKGVAQKCRTHGVGVDECADLHVNTKVIGPLLRSTETIAAWKRDALVIARRLRDLYRECATSEDIPRVAGMQGAFTFQCPGCPSQEWCASDRVARYLESVMVFHPWEGI